MWRTRANLEWPVATKRSADSHDTGWKNRYSYTEQLQSGAFLTQTLHCYWVFPVLWLLFVAIARKSGCVFFLPLECLPVYVPSPSRRDLTSLPSFCRFPSHIWSSVLFHSCLPLTNLANITDISHATCTAGNWDLDWLIACYTHGYSPSRAMAWHSCTSCVIEIVKHSVRILFDCTLRMVHVRSSKNPLCICMVAWGRI